MESLHEIWETYRDGVGFAVVYVREAHPEDGWVITANREQDIAYMDPTIFEEREEIAEACAIRLKIRMPVVIDELDDAIADAYGALPDRLYLIDKGGTIAYQGGLGPQGFKPAELEAAIKKLAAL